MNTTTPADRLLGRITDWAKADPNVRALVLAGSRAGDVQVDDLADVDVRVYAETSAPLTREEAWLHRFAPVWVCVREKYEEGGIVIPTRLVIYKGGLKVDFALYPVEQLETLDSTGMMFKVILDKDRRAPVSPSQPVIAGPPGETEFLRVVEEFWFEAYHVAKFIARGELWLAKFRDGETKKFLLQMIEWHAGARMGWHIDTRYPGKNLEMWTTPDVWSELHGAFAHFDAADSVRALQVTTSLFRRIAKETAGLLNVVYPEGVDENLSNFIDEILTEHLY